MLLRYWFLFRVLLERLELGFYSLYHALKIPLWRSLVILLYFTALGKLLNCVLKITSDGINNSFHFILISENNRSLASENMLWCRWLNCIIRTFFGLRHRPVRFLFCTNVTPSFLTCPHPSFLTCHLNGAGHNQNGTLADGLTHQWSIRNNPKFCYKWR